MRRMWMSVWMLGAGGVGALSCQPPVPADAPVSSGSTLEEPATRVVFSIQEPDLLPENVAWDPQTRSHFVGSTRKGKILRIQDGEVSDFKAAREDGLWMVIGMKVDAERRSLWVCSSQGGNLTGDTVDGNSAAGLFRFDLDSGELLDRWILEGDGEDHFLNDLVVAPNGRVFVTHMFETPSVWTAEADGDFVELTRLDAESYPNGIALAEGAQAAVVATRWGLLRVPVDGAIPTPIKASDPATTTGIDGLYSVGGRLIAVRPDPGSVWAYQLDDTGTTVVSAEPLLTDHASFFGPTTGVVVGDELHFIANAQFDLVAEDGSLPALSELHDPVVLGVGIGASR